MDFQLTFEFGTNTLVKEKNPDEPISKLYENVQY